MNSVLDQGYSYWKKIYEANEVTINIPKDGKTVGNYRESIMDFTFDRATSDMIKEIAKNSEKNIFIILLTSMNILLRKYSYNHTIRIGMPVPLSNPLQENENKITIVQTSIDGDETVRKVLNDVRENYLLACKYADYEFDDKDMYHQDLFQQDTMLLTMERLHNKVEKDCSILHINFEVSEDIIMGHVHYEANCFTQKSMNRLVTLIKQTTSYMLEQRSTKIDDFDILSERNKEELTSTVNFNPCKVSMVRVNQLIEEVCKECADNIALSDAEKEMTYATLWKESGKITDYLLRQKIGRGDVVGILTSRTCDFVIAIVGVLRSGAAFVPIDNSLPQKRIEYYLTNSEAKLVIVKDSNFKGSIPMVTFDEISTDNTTISNWNELGDSTDVAYILFTSGSTGRPKGVEICHISISNLVQSLYDGIYSSYSKTTRIGLLTSFSFDPTIMQVFVSLLRGFTLEIIPEQVNKDGHLLLDYITEKKVDTMAGTPTHLRLLMEGNRQNENALFQKSIIVGGEILDVKLLQEFNSMFHRKAPQIINLYGPTETCVASTYHIATLDEFETRSSIPIGKGMYNTPIYILDENRNLMPFGATGEIYIGGYQVAKGYINKEEETAKQFVENPFRPGEKMYRTGDIGRFLSDNSLTYIGRVDNQVKVRGFRIELEEIETILKEQSGIQNATVVVDQKGEDANLIAFIVRDNKELMLEEFKHMIEQVLPYYMVPNHIVELDHIPYNMNGKVDKEKLLKLTLEQEDFIQPRDEMEQNIYCIWKALLGREDFGVKNNFFALGGHSLKLMRMINLIYEKYHCDIPLNLLFEHTNIEWICNYMKQHKNQMIPTIKASVKKEYYSLSSTQRRMYITHKMDQTSIAYNTPMLLRLDGIVNESRLELAVQEVINRHEILRTVFVERDNEVVQKVLDNLEFHLTVRLVTKDDMKHITDMILPFDLECGPLVRLDLLKYDTNTYYLLLDMHHIITDLISIRLFLEQVAQIYNEEEIIVSFMQYRDFSEWQNEQIHSGAFNDIEAYWLKEFSQGIPRLDLPTDYQKPAIQSFKGRSLTVKIKEELTKQLKNFAKANGVTLQMVLLSVYGILLSKYSDKTEVPIGVPVAARTHKEMNGILGAILNTVLIKLSIDTNTVYCDFIQEVRRKMVDALNHQDYPFDLLIELLGKLHSIQRGNIYEASFNYYSNDESMPIDLFHGFNTTQEELEYTVSHSNVDMTCMEFENTLKVTMNYSVELYDQETMEFFVKHYIQLLQNVMENTNIQIKDLDMLTQEEKEDFSYGFGDI